MNSKTARSQYIFVKSIHKTMPECRFNKPVAPSKRDYRIKPTSNQKSTIARRDLRCGDHQCGCGISRLFFRDWPELGIPTIKKAHKWDHKWDRVDGRVDGLQIKCPHPQEEEEAGGGGFFDRCKNDLKRKYRERGSGGAGCWRAPRRLLVFFPPYLLWPPHSTSRPPRPPPAMDHQLSGVVCYKSCQ
jgi:hypothetical protein